MTSKLTCLTGAFYLSLNLGCGGLVAAQSAGPQPTPLPPAIAQPRDIPYPGTISLYVDASDVERHLFKVRETIPVRGGQGLTLLLPEWLPGSHSPTGRAEKLAGLVIHGPAGRLEWTRDAVNVFAFHVGVPPGATSIDVEFQFVSAIETNEGRIVMTPEMLNLQWPTVSLYPAGYYARQIPVQATVNLPEGWALATSLDTASTSGSITTFKTVPYETLVDSPIFAGRYVKRFDLDPGASAPVRLNAFADREELLTARPEQLGSHTALVRQAYALFGGRHFDHYEFLVALTERMGGIGLEHLRSSENAMAPGYFTEWDRHTDRRDQLAHEFVHSWNGKFRRPADLWTPTYNVPMRDSLLWMYEGQTQYWGAVLAARSGLWTKQQALDALAWVAAVYDHRIGRDWRPLQDTTNDPIAARRTATPWRSWTRAEDYYSEGQLIWLDADTLMRELSGGRRSLDDFANAFFGIEHGSDVPVTYTFDDLVRTLNGIQPYDWATFLRSRLDGHGPGAPLGGVTRGGYALVYTDTPTPFFSGAEARQRTTDFTYSLGFVVGREGRLTDVLWEGPAFQQGLTPGSQLIAVNGVTYDADRLKETIREAKKGGPAIDLLVKNGERYRTVRMDYRGGLRYPRLERDPKTPARLDDILTAK